MFEIHFEKYELRQVRKGVTEDFILLQLAGIKAGDIPSGAGKILY